MIEGEANLYEYSVANQRYYFYNKQNSPIEHLIHKEYKIESYKFAQNNKFREQLWSNVSCTKSDLQKYRDLKYKRKDLINVFTQYSQCNQTKITEYKQKNKKDLFNFSLKLGANYSSLSINPSDLRHKLQ